MDIHYGQVTVTGYISNKTHTSTIEQITDALEGVVWKSDAYTTHNYDMTKVKITIEIED